MFDRSQTSERPARRRTVRIVKPWKISRAGAISLVITAGTALLILLIRIITRGEEQVQPRQRTLVDVELEWKCEAGHTFRAAGQVDPRKCWTCDKNAYPVTKFTCPVHGEADVAVRFVVSAEGQTRPDAYRVGAAEWTSAESQPLCSKCQRPMTPVREDPVAKLKQRRHRANESDASRKDQ